jgi:hypothetical protein
MELLSLDPRPIDARPVPTATCLPSACSHGYRFLGHAPLNGVKPRRKLTEVVFKGILESDGKVAACFNPRHGLRAVARGASSRPLIATSACRSSVTAQARRRAR